MNLKSKSNYCNRHIKKNLEKFQHSFLTGEHEKCGEEEFSPHGCRGLASRCQTQFPGTFYLDWDRGSHLARSHATLKTT